jgi:hypothetical protein
MLVGLRLGSRRLPLVLAAESQLLPPTPAAYTSSSEIELLVKVSEIETKMFDGNNRVRR